MKQNPLSGLLHHRRFKTPVQFTDTVSEAYLEQLQKNFSYLAAYLRKCPADSFTPSIKDSVVERVEGLQTGLLHVLEEYLSGRPAPAFDLFAKALKDSSLDAELRTIQLCRIPAGTLYYRTLRHWGEVPKRFYNRQGFLNQKPALALFHPPFERRRSVGTNRFSIPGYPSLYLSGSLHTSYSECFPQDNRGGFHAIAFKNIRPLYFINLTRQLPETGLRFKRLSADAGKKPAPDITGIIEQLGLHQLLVATHTKVAYKPLYEGENFYFKCEYVVPQLLLQWTKAAGLAVDGIRYQSCTGEARFPVRTAHHNYVLPVKTNAASGFCPSLLSLFAASEPYSCFVQRRRGDVNRFLDKVTGELQESTFTPLARSR